MTYVITQNCCNDASCVAACPVGCIHPTPGESAFATTEMLYIDPDACIDCGACADACPVDAIKPDTALTPTEQPYLDINAEHFRSNPTTPAFARAPSPQPLVTSERAMHVAVVGAGPAGLYSTSELLRHPGITVDLYDRLPHTGGLIHHGIAPDHPDTKRVIDQFRFRDDKHRRLTMHLGVTIGSDIHHTDLLDTHHAVIYAHGAFHPRRLDIPGADLPGSLSAAEIVGWYNDHPDHNSAHPPLTGQRAVIVGNGNVALDIARILLSDPDSIPGLADHARNHLRTSTVKEVVVMGRRGPRHAAFTTPELLALHQRSDIDLVIHNADPADLIPDTTAPDRARKLTMLRDIAHQESGGTERRLVLRFHTEPTEITGTERTTGVRLSTGEHLDTELVIHAIGFRGAPVPGIPFDPATATIPQHAGRVLDLETGTPVLGVYTTGWAKRGPSGVIGTNRTCALETVTALLEDHDAGLLSAPRRTTHRARTLQEALS